MSTFNLKYGKNYHVKVNENGDLTLEYTDGKSLYNQTLSAGNLSSQVLVDFCEERIVLSDGKVLRRIRDNLILSN